jgi:hypothetical protein
MHTAETFVPESNTSEFEVAIGRLKSYRSPGVDRFQAGLFKQEGKYCDQRFIKSLS